MAFFDFLKDKKPTPVKTTALTVQEPVVNLASIPDEYEGFSVTYFPHSKKYFPRCPNKYGDSKPSFMRRIMSDTTGEIEPYYGLDDRAEFFKTERGAWEFIDEYLMQQKRGFSVQILKHPHRR